ncbi:MAG: hypothetical protein AAF183_20040 [Pseudomonadota bacterium]
MGIGKKMKKKLRRARRAARRAANNAPKVISSAPKNLMKAAKNTLKDLKALGQATKAMLRQSLEMMKQTLIMTHVTPFLMAKAFLTTGDPDAARDVWCDQCSKFGEEFNKLVDKTMNVAMKAIEMTPADKLLEKFVPQYELAKNIVLTMVSDQLKVIGDAAQSASHFVGAIGNKSLGHCMRAGADVAMYAAEFCSKASPMGTAASVAMTAHELSKSENREAIMEKVKQLRDNPKDAAILMAAVGAECAMGEMSSGPGGKSGGFGLGDGAPGGKGSKGAAPADGSTSSSKRDGVDAGDGSSTKPAKDTKDTKDKSDDDDGTPIEDAANNAVLAAELAMFGPDPMMYAGGSPGFYNFQNPKDAFPDFAKFDVFKPEDLMAMLFMPLMNLPKVDDFDSTSVWEEMDQAEALRKQAAAGDTGLAPAELAVAAPSPLSESRQPDLVGG